MCPQQHIERLGSGLIQIPSECTLLLIHSLDHSTCWFTVWIYRKTQSSIRHRAPLSAKTGYHVNVWDESKEQSCFNKDSGSLVGLWIGSVNEGIEAVLCDSINEKKLADHASIFMARATFKPIFSIHIAHYLVNLYHSAKNLHHWSCTFLILTEEKIFPLAWEVIESLEMYNKIPVTSLLTLTADGARQNRWFYRLCQKRKATLQVHLLQSQR